jgi:hypothetical protein
MADESQPTMRSAESGGALVPLSCPDCGGVLSETREGPQRVPFFVCQIEHRFTAPSLFVAKEEKLEETLWSGVTQSKQILSLYETLLKEDVLPPGIDRTALQRRIGQLSRHESEIRAVVTDTSAVTSTP